MKQNKTKLKKTLKTAFDPTYVLRAITANYVDYVYKQFGIGQTRFDRLILQQKSKQDFKGMTIHFWLTPNCLCTIRSSSVVEKISGTEADVINNFLNSITTQL